MKKVLIFGGGLAGLSLATELCDEGFKVTVLEKNSFLGGRASNQTDETMHQPIPIGPHIFLTAYNNFLRFLDKIGAKHQISWERKLFIDVVYGGRHHQSRMSRLPHPLWTFPIFCRYPFLSWKDKLSNLRLVFELLRTPRKKAEKLDHINAYDFLKHCGVNENSINKLWRFFTLSMLNVPLELCSAADFALLINFWGSIEHRSVGFAKTGLGDLYANNAKGYIQKNGGRILLNTRIKQIVFNKADIDHILDSNYQKIAADLYVSTLTPVDLRALLPEHILFSDFFRHLNAFEGVPYISTNLWFDKKVTDKKFWALLNDGPIPKNMNTDFYDYSNIFPERHRGSYITSNIIYSKAYDSMSDEEIVGKTLEELRETFPKMDAKLEHYEIHRIPYAIYAPYPGMRSHKLPHKTPISNFYLTGDWTETKMTQSMEAAVRSGYKCAEQILADCGKNKRICDERLV